MQATILHKQILWAMACCILSTTLAGAKTSDSTKKKEFTKSFPATASTTLEVDNSFGNIAVEHGNKKEVEIRVIIESKAGDERTAEKNLNKVAVDITARGNTIKVVTGTNNRNQKDKEQVTVNYTLVVPSEVKLSLSQQFGNIYLPVDGHQGEASFSIKFGRLEGGSFSAPVSVDSQFSNIALRNLANATFSLQHCEKVTIGNAENVEVSSQFSNLETGHVQTFRLDEKHGSSKIKSCGSLILQAQYSNITVNRLTYSAQIKSLSHSGLKINEVAENFSEISAKANFGNITLALPPATSFRLDAQAAFGNIRWDSDFKPQEQTILEKNSNKSVKCNFNGGKKGSIQFDGHFSSLMIEKL